MRHSKSPANRQRGVALVVSLIFLLIVTIISVTAARNSALSLRASGNLQDQNHSQQAADAAAFGALALAGTADDPFTASAQPVNPFAANSTPLAKLRDPTNVEAQLTLRATEAACPRPRFERDGSSVGTFSCDYYQVDAEHEIPERARTRISLGVVKSVLTSR
ncbi:hypothetical protein E4634_08740 [Mangrovimicrobium sediminis]|uniref:Type 4 fimbrial biogenesis protein PilX N-terminal domain-containing protein n=1 Tax=Mangrovimicrobium sediminis TaxID=2562682 RepID=A0A4Z0M3L5_9GAMM|nr:PilX N-terminal domain-containing pilus assembly protein [Haliea sp. SAOS-164]TGD74202.1 hypothetical protein E4634_08740 [Haliea sp. SAOS-164]